MYIKKSIIVLMSIITATFSVSCGQSEKNDKLGKSNKSITDILGTQTRLNGKYVKFCYEYFEELNDISRDRSKDFDHIFTYKYEDETYGLSKKNEDWETQWYRNGVIEFEDGKFTAYTNHRKTDGVAGSLRKDLSNERTTSVCCIYGNYKLDDEGIKFEYKNCKYIYKNYVFNNTDGEYMLDNEYEEYDEEFPAVVKKVMDSGACFNAFSYLVETNFQGLPNAFDFDLLPYFVHCPSNYTNGSDKVIDPVFLKPIDDFLCFDTNGLVLDDKYELGKSFSFKFDPMAVLEENEYVQLTDSISNNIDSQLGAEGDQNTSLVFEDGKWEWLKADGELINSGAYVESEIFPGLIVMVTTEDSKGYFEMPYTHFYIASDGEVYYPCMYKFED